MKVPWVLLWWLGFKGFHLFLSLWMWWLVRSRNESAWSSFLSGLIWTRNFNSIQFSCAWDSGCFVHATCCFWPVFNVCLPIRLGFHLHFCYFEHQFVYSLIWLVFLVIFIGSQLVWIYCCLIILCFDKPLWLCMWNLLQIFIDYAILVGKLTYLEIFFILYLFCHLFCYHT